MNKLSNYLKSINKWQLMIIVVAISTISWLLLNAYVFKSVCALGTMCPAHDPTLWPRIGIVVVCAAIALWLVRSEKIS